MASTQRFLTVYHALNPNIDELDFKTDLGRGTIILYIYIQSEAQILILKSVSFITKLFAYS